MDSYNCNTAYLLAYSFMQVPGYYEVSIQFYRHRFCIVSFLFASNTIFNIGAAIDQWLVHSFAGSVWSIGVC